MEFNRREFMRVAGAGAVSAGLAGIVGCATGISVDAIPLPDDSKFTRDDQRGVSIDGILKEVFTDEAYEAIKDIPLITTPYMEGAFAAGVNGWSKIASFFLGAGYQGRKVIIGERLFDYRLENEIEKTETLAFRNNLNDMMEEFHEIKTKEEYANNIHEKNKKRKSRIKIILHEYVHHADDLRFADREKLKNVYDAYFYGGKNIWKDGYFKKFKEDLKFGLKEHRELSTFHELFGVGMDREILAFVGSYIGMGYAVPAEFKVPFVRMLKNASLPEKEKIDNLELESINLFPGNRTGHTLLKF